MKHFLRPTLTAVALAVALGMTGGAFAQAAKTGATGTVDKAKASYVVGYWEMASQVPPIMRDELDAAAVGRARAGRAVRSEVDHERCRGQAGA